uniref:Predicted gene 12689 n=1 Tax=Cricetulus griseus TaxID=10029 RepID=A0A8C2LGB9_CRIGR
CVASLFTAGKLQETPSPRAAAVDAFITAARPGVCSKARGSANGAAFHRMVLPSDLGALAYSSRRWWGDGVKTRVEGQGEINCAQTITMGSKPQNIYLFRLNGSIKWTPAMFLA